MNAPPTGMMASLAAATVAILIYLMRAAGWEQPPSETVAALIVVLNYAGHAGHRIFIWYMRRQYPDFPDVAEGGDSVERKSRATEERPATATGNAQS